MYLLKRLSWIHYAWYVVAAGFIAQLVASGLRSTFGVYLNPIETDLGVTRSNIALVASLSILMNGLIQPVVGHLLDRYGTRAVAIGCLSIAAGGIVVSSFVTGLWQLYITFGIVVSAAVGGPSTVMATVVATRWFVKHRGLVLGLMSSANAAGQLILIPLAMQLNLVYGWRMSYLLFGIGMAVLVLPLGLVIRHDPKDIGKQPVGAGEAASSVKARQLSDDARKTPLVVAMRTRDFWMLALAFFVCGYTAAGTVSTHLVAFTAERGFDGMIAAAAVGLMGAVSFAGTILTGIITDRIGYKNPLAVIYFFRGLALLFLLIVTDALSLNVFAVLFGLAYFATVVPTSALTGNIFGRLSVGTVFGVVFMTHQIGGAIGSYVTGLIFDLTGTYYLAILLAAILCFVASAMILSMKVHRVGVPAPAPA